MVIFVGLMEQNTIAQQKIAQISYTNLQYFCKVLLTG